MPILHTDRLGPAARNARNRVTSLDDLIKDLESDRNNHDAELAQALDGITDEDIIAKVKQHFACIAEERSILHEALVQTTTLTDSMRRRVRTCRTILERQ